MVSCHAHILTTRPVLVSGGQNRPHTNIVVMLCFAKIDPRNAPFSSIFAILKNIIIERVFETSRRLIKSQTYLDKNSAR
jgi:hypothetical protein